MDFKKTVLVSLLATFFLLCSCSNSIPKETVEDNVDFKKIVNQKENDIYEEYVSSFRKVSFSEYMNWKKDSDLIENECYVYFGRSTCPDCREFIYNTINIYKMKNVVYMDTSLLSESEIRKMKVNEVPSIVYFNSNGKSSSITVEKFQEKVKELHPY